MDANGTPVQSLPGPLARWCGIVVGWCCVEWLEQQATRQTQRASVLAVGLGALEVIGLSRYLISRRGLREEESSNSSIVG